MLTEPHLTTWKQSTVIYSAYLLNINTIYYVLTVLCIFSDCWLLYIWWMWRCECMYSILQTGKAWHKPSVVLLYLVQKQMYCTMGFKVFVRGGLVTACHLLPFRESHYTRWIIATVSIKYNGLLLVDMGIIYVRTMIK